MPRPPPRSTFFPYTTLFRSKASMAAALSSLCSSAGVCGEVSRMKMSVSMMNCFNCHAFLVKSERYARIKRSEEHTSELQSRGHLVCRLLLEEKNLRAYRDLV